MLLEQGPIAQTHTLLSAALLGLCVCVCACVWDVYYLYIRWLLVSAGIASMFLNISCEIVWNSQVSDDNDSLTALSGPRCFPANTHTHTHFLRGTIRYAGTPTDQQDVGLCEAKPNKALFPQETKRFCR